MVDNIIWKAFKLGGLFERRKLALAKSLKTLDLSELKTKDTDIALISASRNGSGCVGYLKLEDVNAKLISINKITFDDQWGFTYWQRENFVITGGHNSILEIKDLNLDKLVATKPIILGFLSKLINKITIKAGIFGYNFKINNKLDRELLLLPLIETLQNEDHIWEFDGKCYTLAVDYISLLMNKAKDKKEEKTIKLYKAKREEYKAKREAEKKSLVWKVFKLGDLFSQSMEHYLEKSKKNYNLSDTKTKEYPIAVCAASKNNNGIVGYIQEVDDVPTKKRRGFLTKSGFGHVFYQDDWFVKPGGSWGMLNILKFNNDKLKYICDKNKVCYNFFAKMLTKILVPFSAYSFVTPFDRELLLLPLIETLQNEDHIWEFDGKCYTLAVGTISWLYYSGLVKQQDNKIEKYTYSY